MKVLVVLNGPANDAERSILERREVVLLRELRAQGVEVSVALCGDAGGLATDLRHSDTPVTVIPIALPPRAATLFRIPFAALRLRTLIKRIRPDLVEATEAMPAIAAAIAARRTTVIYRREHGGGRRMRLVMASRLAARLADRTIVSCQAMRQQAAIDDRTELDRIEIATPGTAEPPIISGEECAAAREAIGIHNGAKVIGVISRFRREKGLDTLIRATRRLSDVHLIIAGDGPEESHLRALAADSPHPIHFLGHRNDIARLMRIADVVAIPSRRESFGRVVLEAMANGRPVVATRAGGLAEAVVDGETGLLVPIDDETSLAAALHRLLTDDVLAQTFGDAARERYRSRHTIAHMADARRAAWERSLA
jgi:glycosyltransferase involved in cell wall biosynthesis